MTLAAGAGMGILVDEATGSRDIHTQFGYSEYCPRRRAVTPDPVPRLLAICAFPGGIIPSFLHAGRPALFSCHFHWAVGFNVAQLLSSSFVPVLSVCCCVIITRTFPRHGCSPTAHLQDVYAW